jgi:CTP:molybdopterin cytidylyltransferase MocA
VRQVVAVILAAGEAKRFRRSPDETKLIAELDGKPIVRHVAEAALASRARPVLLVTGHAHAQVASALDGLMLVSRFRSSYAHFACVSSVRRQKRSMDARMSPADFVQRNGLGAAFLILI